MRPQIYIPSSDKKPLQPNEALAAVGLDNITGVSTTEGAGPDGARGMFYTWIDSANVGIGYDEPHQTWVKSVKSGDREPGAYWVGWKSNKPPTEQDLRRPDSRKGEWIQLGNDERWIVTTPNKLDRFPMLQEDGSLTWVVDEKFNWLTQELDRKRETSIVRQDDGDGSGERITIIFDDSADFDFFCRLLAINYRTTPELICHLKLFNQDTLRSLGVSLLGLNLIQDDA
ncbi:MAG: hypothetical protein ABJZ55_16055 [Fuerstiella sp.]